MKTMLFVDDRTTRIHWAAAHYPQNGYEVTIACNVPEALRLMCRKPWDVVSLDHDLNGHDFEDPESTGCGMEILRYIEKCGGWPDKTVNHVLLPMNNDELPHIRAPEIWVHSSNIFAAHQMIIKASFLRLKAYWKPIRSNSDYIQYDEKGIPK